MSEIRGAPEGGGHGGNICHLIVYNRAPAEKLTNMCFVTPLTHSL